MNRKAQNVKAVWQVNSQEQRPMEDEKEKGAIPDTRELILSTIWTTLLEQ